MNRDDIIRMARKAGFVIYEEAYFRHLFGTQPNYIVIDEGLTRFANLVAAAEREGCAAFLETGVDMKGLAGDPVWTKYTFELLTGCAAAIRARGNDD